MRGGYIPSLKKIVPAILIYKSLMCVFFYLADLQTKTAIQLRHVIQLH